ncbi:unnamed protein product [Nippostrongylus brasiliensis]|uniref:Uncharacterized protein n=1 Tax=Nippostrongylus brasiliensis TaxID=27835 RepID=A0A3P7AU74_NIPBR|nr:unnamed protein product [Nippostrongylus brasiliensis]
MSSRLLQSKPSKRFRRGSPYVVEKSGDGGSLDDAVELLSEDSQVPAHLNTTLGHLLEKAKLTEELLTKNRTDEDETSHVEEKTSKSVIISSIAVKSGDGKLIEKEGVESGNDTIPFAPGLQITGLTKRVFSGFRLAQAALYGVHGLCQPESGEHSLRKAESEGTPPSQTKTCAADTIFCKKGAHGSGPDGTAIFAYDCDDTGNCQVGYRH